MRQMAGAEGRQQLGGFAGGGWALTGNTPWVGQSQLRLIVGTHWPSILWLTEASEQGNESGL